MSARDAFLYGIAGGAGAEILGLFKLRREGAPQYLRSRFYWVVTVLMVLAGGGVAFVYVESKVDLTPLLAVNVGAAAPLIIGQLIAQAPEVNPGRIS